MNKKIITIAEIVFALVFVVLLAVFMATINSKGNSANSKLVDTLEMTDGTSLDKYKSGEAVKGTDVTNVVQNYKTIGGNTKMTIYVLTNGSANSDNSETRKGARYGYKEGSSDEYPSYRATSTDDEYINPSGNFYPAVVYNSNDVEIGIMFLQDNAGTTQFDPTKITGGAKAIPEKAPNQNKN